jgi:serine/threonine-protein kinase HipA
MTSDPYPARRVFVWTWLPGESTPVVAGAVDRAGADRLDFTYARSYLDNEKAISLYARLDGRGPLVRGCRRRRAE